jgi:hypothetical protein
MRKLISLDAYPELYDNDRFDHIEFSDFRIVPDYSLKTDAGDSMTTTWGGWQKARKLGGRSDTEEKDLNTSFNSKGSMLNRPAPAVFTLNGVDYFYITGMGRDSIYEKYNFTNRLVAVYVKKEGSTDDQVANELSQLGNIFNPADLPSVPAKEYDIIDEASRALSNGWCNHDLTSIMDRMRPQCQAVGIGETKTSHMATTVYNAKLPSHLRTLPMTAEKSKKWMTDSGKKYIDIPNKIRYITKSYDFVTKGQVDAVLLAKKNPSTEIRVVLHCGILTNGIDQYNKRVESFWSNWYTQLDAYQQVVFGGADQKIKNLVLYGIIPQVGEEHDTSQLCIFDQKSAVCQYTQRSDGKTRTWTLPSSK